MTCCKQSTLKGECGTAFLQIMPDRTKRNFDLLSRQLIIEGRFPVCLVCSDALDALGLSRYCCRRMLMTHVGECASLLVQMI